MGSLGWVAGLHGWQVRQRLDEFFDPFKVEGRYEHQAVTRRGGGVAVLSGLSVRSRKHANGNEAGQALRDAHRDAVVFAASAAGLTAGVLVRSAVVRLLGDPLARGGAEVVSDEFADVFSVLLLDALDVSPALVVERWPFWRWRDLDSENLAELVRMAFDLVGGAA